MKRRTKLYLKRNIPTILSVLSAVGLVATTVSAIKVALEIEENKKKAEEEKGEKLTKLEVAQITIPKMLPTMLLGTTTLVCIFGANTLNRRHQASLASAYGLLDQSYKKYQNKLIELHGTDIHDEVVDAIVAEDAEARYVTSGCLFTNCRQFLDEDYSDPILFCINSGEKRFLQRR